MWHKWTAGEKAVSFFCFAFALALLPGAYFDPSVDSVPGLIRMGAVGCMMFGAGLSPAMFFRPLGSPSDPAEDPAYRRGLLVGIMLFGVAAAVELVSFAVRL